MTNRYSIQRYSIYLCYYAKADSEHITKKYKHAEPALVSAGPWQGLDAMASAERVPIRVSGAEPAAGVQGHSPRWSCLLYTSPSPRD